MRRRCVGLALCEPGSCWPRRRADAKAKAVEPYKVLVVTSTTDATSAAGISAITAAVGADGVVTAPAPAAVGAQFTPADLDQYRAVVFLNTGMASPLTDAQRANFEAYYKKGGGFVGIGSAIETDASWPFLTEHARHALVGPHRIAVAHRQGLRPRPRREQEPAASTGSAPSPSTTSTRTSAASRTC